MINQYIRLYDGYGNGSLRSLGGGHNLVTSLGGCSLHTVDAHPTSTLQTMTEHGSHCKEAHCSKIWTLPMDNSQEDQLS